MTPRRRDDCGAPPYISGYGTFFPFFLHYHARAEKSDAVSKTDINILDSAAAAIISAAGDRCHG